MKNLLFLVLIITALTIVTGCEKSTTTDTLNEDLCAGVDCQNGGTCYLGLCDCSTGWTGSDCSTQVTPSKIQINKIVIRDFPQYDNGSTWDLNSGPDIFVKFALGSNVIYTQPTVFQDASSGHSLTLTPSQPIIVTSPLSRYAIYLYDYDSGFGGNNDYMGGVEFNIYSSTNNFPGVVTASYGSIKVDFYITYNW